jgi:hypothetical protein
MRAPTPEQLEQKSNTAAVENMPTAGGQEQWRGAQRSGNERHVVRETVDLNTQDELASAGLPSKSARRRKAGG